MPPFCDLVNLVSSLFSLILSVLAILLSIVFYLSAKKSEIETAKTQVSINDKIDTLGIINNDLLKTAIQHLGDSNSRMIDALREYSQKMRNVTVTPVESEHSPKPDVRTDILSAIKLISSRTGRAISLEVFDELKRSYDFGTILAELIRMHREGILTWAEAPNPPEALSPITISSAK